MFLDVVPASFEDVLAEGTGVVRDLWLKLDGVLIDSCNVFVVEVNSEVVRVELQRLAFGIAATIAGTRGFLWEKERKMLWKVWLFNPSGLLFWGLETKFSLG